MKKILVLGAGIFQLPGILKAKNLGHYVISLDNIPNNIGHKYSDESVNISIDNIDSVVDFAKKKSINGICTFSSDIAIPTVAAVCYELDLPGVNIRVANILSKKHLFRDFLNEHNYPNPKYSYSSEYDKLLYFLKFFKYPILFKPCDTSGSRGIAMVSKINRKNENYAFNSAKKYSKSGFVCVEEFIDGKEYGGDGFIINGKLKFIGITNKYLNGFVVTGHQYPSGLSNSKINDIKRMLESICRLIGYNDGPINFDIMISQNEIYILEISPRTGGNGIPEIINHVTGVDLQDATIKLSLGESIDLSPKSVNFQAGSFVFGSEESGLLENIADGNELTGKIKGVYKIVFAKNIGSQVKKFEHNGNLIGYALFDCNSLDEYARITEVINDNLKIEINDFI